jgi:hypothetical protein
LGHDALRRGMPLWPAVAAVALSALILAGSLPIGGTLRSDSAEPAQPVMGFFGVTASFAGWTWFGSGAPCERGSNLTFVGHFFANVTGGVPPFSYSWNFGDGSNNSPVRNATHVFLTDQDEWTVNVTARDSPGGNVTDTVVVSPPVFGCPAEATQTANLLPLFLLALVVPALVAGIVGIVVTTRSRRRRGN